MRAERPYPASPTVHVKVRFVIAQHHGAAVHRINFLGPPIDQSEVVVVRGECLRVASQNDVRPPVQYPRGALPVPPQQASVAVHVVGHDAIVGEMVFAVAKEILVACVSKPLSVNLEANERCEARVPAHRAKAKLILLPSNRLIKSNALVDAAGNVPVAWEAMALRHGEQIREHVRCPALRTEQPLQHRHATHVIVVKVADQCHFDAVDVEPFFEPVEPVQQRAPAFGYRQAGLLPDPLAVQLSD